MTTKHPDNHAFKMTRGFGWRSAVLAGCSLFLAFGVRADDFTWVGNGIDDNFLTAENWAGGMAPPADSLGTHNLLFPTPATGNNVFVGVTLPGYRFARIEFNADTDFTA